MSEQLMVCVVAMSKHARRFVLCEDAASPNSQLDFQIHRLMIATANLPHREGAVFLRY